MWVKGGNKCDKLSVSERGTSIWIHYYVLVKNVGSLAYCKVKNILCFLLLQFINKLHFQYSDRFDLTERTEGNKKPISDEIWEKQT